VNAHRREQTIILTLNERGRYEEVERTNPVDPHKAHERLSLALETLVGAGPIKERLRLAAVTLVAVRTEDFAHGEARLRYTTIRADLTTEGTVDATIDAISVEQAEDITGRIVQLFRVVAFPEDAAG
jgi:membrane protein YdbS with pleckstrin-like domain